MTQQKEEEVNLDRAIIDTVLALQEFSEDGVSFSLIQKGVTDLMGGRAPTPETIHRKVEWLLDYDGMLHRTEGGGFYTPDLDAFMVEVGIPSLGDNRKHASLEDEDMDEYVRHATLHGGVTEDLSELFEGMF